MKVIDADTLFAAGESGAVVKTTDGGATWRLLNTESDNFFWAIDFVTPQVGYGGDFGSDRFVKTTNGGETWSLHVLNIEDPPQPYYATRGLHFVSPDTGVMMEHDYMIRTVNGGMSWSVVDSVEDLYDMFFYDRFVGYVTASTGVFSTTDGGHHWHAISGLQGGFDPVFVSAKAGFMYRDGETILKTTDGGYNWFSIYTFPYDGWVYRASLSFVDSTRGYYVGRSTDGAGPGIPTAYRTTDGGYSWIPLTIPVTGNHFDFNWVTAVDDSIAFICGDQGYLWKTTDGGVTWVNQRKGLDFGMTGEFANSQIGYAITVRDAPASSDDLYKTTDGGTNWFHVLHSGNGYEPDVVDVLSPDTVVVVNSQPDVYKTSNGGLTWQHTYGGNGNAYGIDFYSWSVGYVSATHQILKGVNNFWQVKYSSTGWLGPQKVQCFGVDTVYAIDEDKLVKSSDGGNTWQTYDTGLGEMLWDFKFVNQNVGYVVGGYWDTKAIGKTTDGGLTWIDLEPYLDLTGVQTVQIQAVDFVDEYRGLIGTEFGDIFYTDDGGYTWAYEKVTSNWITKLQFVHPDTAFAFGYGSVVLVRTPQNPNDIRRSSETMRPGAFTLHQNYPNPFNPSTTIRYTLNSSMRVRLTIYNTLGQEVATLDAGMKSAGTHEVVWNGLDRSGHSAASGVYLIRLETGGRSAVRKALLIR